MTKESSRAGATLMKPKSSGVGAMFVNKRAAELELCHFYNGSTALLSTNNPSISAKYNFYRNKITHIKGSLEQNYYSSKFENCGNNVKKT